MTNRCLLLLVLSVFMACTLDIHAFAPLTTRHHRHSAAATSTRSTPFSSSSTQLSERPWNFNEGRSPWGLKKNAEIWNGRVAQMCFTIVFLQELIQGHGVIKGVQDGDPINIALLAGTVLSILGLTVFLAIQGDDDFME